MSRRPLLPLLLVLSIVACAPKQEPTAAGPAGPESVVAADPERDNLLTITNGAVVVSRTAELDLENSAAHAIDGIGETMWATPVGRAEQALVFSLGAPSRIDRLGITTNLAKAEVAPLRFSASDDGRTWREVFTLPPEEEKGPRIVPVPPFDARYLRVETAAPGMSYTKILSLHAYGRETAAPQPQSFTGCWTINGSPAVLWQKGARVIGVIGTREPTTVDGSIEGRYARVMWTRGPTWGYALIALSADGEALTAVTFHTNPRVENVGRAWFGRRCAAPPRLEPAKPYDFVAIAGHWSVENAAAADVAKLIASVPGRKLRIVGYEYREATPEANRRRLDARLAALRAELQKQGAALDRVELVVATEPLEWTVTELRSEIQRTLWSRMDFMPLR